MIIELAPADGDDVAFLSLTQRIMNGAIAEFGMREAFLVQVDNWFDHKWLGCLGRWLQTCFRTLPHSLMRRLLDSGTVAYLWIEAPPLFQQLAHWARLGRELEASPSVTQDAIARVLAGQAPYDELPDPAQAMLHGRHETRAQGVGQRRALDGPPDKVPEQRQDCEADRTGQSKDRERPGSALEPSRPRWGSRRCPRPCSATPRNRAWR